MNTAPSGPEVISQRKRVGRPPKPTQSRQSNSEGSVEEESPSTSETAMSKKDVDDILVVDGAALAISPPLVKDTTDACNSRVPAAPTTSGECRRSSRKKIIKFDVRDLLNKHRKPHKIQIEARIDSNAPQTPKSTAPGSMGSGSASGTSVPASNSDLSSKQKAFMEKSAIFRRISISEKQNQLNAPPLPPPLSAVPKMSMLGTINRKSNADVLSAMDPAKIAQARRLSRTQEIFNASLMKSKQNSSLIVAQIESSSCSSSSGLISQKVSTPPQQRKATNVSTKRKSIPNSLSASVQNVDVQSSTPETGVQKRRGRPPKNKAPLAQTKNKITVVGKNLDQQKYKSLEDVTKELEKNDAVRRANLSNATNWKEYKATLNRVSNSAKASQIMASRVQKPLQQEKKPTFQNEDVILEISSTSSASDHEIQQETTSSTTNAQESPPRNFASVCILQESPSVCEVTDADEFIVAAVEEITTENSQSAKSISLEPGDITTSAQDVANVVVVGDEQNTININLNMDISKETEIASNSFSEVTYRESYGSRKSSGSESESGSDRSNKSYKKGDKLRISVKRLTMPQDECVSTISLSSASNSCSDIVVGSSANNSRNNNSGENNGATTESNTVATSKALPTRRSHRIPRRSTANKSKSSESDSDSKISSNESFDTKIQMKITEKETEKKGGLPVELSVLKNDGKTDIDFELSTVDENNVTVKAIENIVDAVQVEERQLAKGAAQNSIVEVSAVQVKETSLACIINVKDLVERVEDGRKEYEKQVSGTCALSQVVVPSTSNETKKERITLPIKKQASKFKMYEEAVHNVAANVETSTLLDILKTVKQNDLTMGTTEGTLQKEAQVEIPTACQQMQLKTLVNKEEKIETNCAANETHTSKEMLIDTKTLIASEHPSDTNVDITSSRIQEMSPDRKVRTDEKFEATLEILPVESLTDQRQLAVVKFDSLKDAISEVLAERASPAAQSPEGSTATEAIPDNSSAEKLKSHTADNETILSDFSQEGSRASKSSTKVCNVLNLTDNLESQSITNEAATGQVLDESSMGGVSPTTDSQPSGDEQTKVATKKTPSPTPSENSIGCYSKKPTRRYERRSQRGDVSAHKTLEETFAEIAAESSKAVLDLKAKKVEVPKESSAMITATLSNAVELEKSAEKSSSSDIPANVVDVNKCKTTDNATLTMTIEANRTPSPKLEDDKVLTTTSTQSNSSPKLEDNKVLTTSAQNIEEATAKVTSPEINSKADCSFSKLLSVLDDGDSNSNHSSPSRRRGRQRNKNDKDINKSSPSIEATKEVPIEGPSDTITNLALECKSLLIPAPDSHTASKQKLINMASSAPEGNVLKITEHNLRPESVTQIVEPPESIPLEEEFANAAETEIVLETAIIADIQDDQAEMAEITVETTEFEIPENQESQDANASASISTVTSGEVSPKGTKERKEKIKSRKHKKETNSSSSEAHQAKNSKLERQMEELPKSLTSSEDSPKNATENALQNETRIEPTAATKEDKAATTSTKEDQSADIKICADNCEGKAQKADNQMVEQRSQSETPLAKPKKEKKRKNTKQYSDDKLGDIKDLNSSTEETKILESKGKNNEAGDVVGKTRKPRKGKTAQEPIKKGNTSDGDAVSESVAVETERKEEILAKAPPKKRLLKMQMQLEEKSASACYSVSSELATTSAADVETKSPSAKKSVTETGKTNESSHKKTNKGTQASDDKKRTSFESQQESSVEEESRSATSTPLAKRFKHQKSLEKTPEDKAKSSSKRKPKLDLLSDSAEKSDTTKPEIKDKDKPLSASKKSEKKKSLATEESASNESGQKMEDKNAKKKRQKKLKEAFEAALKDALLKSEDHTDSPQSSVNAAAIDVPSITEDRVEQSPPAATAVAADQQVSTTETIENQPPEPIIANEPEEEPDPLKDIEKFIEDGVNLLKRGYKIEDDSVDEVICPKTITKQDDFNSEITKQVEEATGASNSPVVEGMITPNESISGEVTPPDKSFEEPHSAQSPNIYYETPADTPVSTPTTTPPPKSPSYDSSFDEISGVRRSHRIKLITKTPKALVGRGLVREKERFSIKDDVEMKTHYSLDDHLTDLAQVEAKNAKFLKEMEERLSNFHVIKENEYKCERVISREARKMVCDCFLTSEEEVRGELGCGDDCLNRLLMIECGPDCNVKDRCTNKRFQKLLCSPCRVFRTEKKGFGIMADIEILPGEFIMEYVGEVINGDEFERRRIVYSQDKNRHYYFMALRSDAIIDATIKGNISRFINHSCDPNAETQKWTVNGELRIGFFSRKSIMPGEEITFDYQYQRYGREAQRCYCESANCRGWIGEEPNSDEGEQIDDDSDADNLADGSDEDESDDSIGDGEDAHKKLDVDGTANKSAFGGEDDKLKLEEKLDGSGKEKKKKLGEDEYKEEDDDTKIKLKKLSGKSMDKASRKKKQNKEKKEKRLRKAVSGKPSKTSRYLEDPDIEDEVKFLSRGGLRNQSDTLRFSRLVVRAKLPQTRLNLLKILRNAEVPCRRLFLDYHGLRLLHGWMCEDGGDMAIRLSLLEALESLPIANKTVLTDSKVYQSVRNWCGNSVPDNSGTAGNTSSPSDESSKESSSSNSQPEIVSGQEVPSELQKLAIKLTTVWNSLPEIFRIPKRERIEQMKEHEREADRQFAEASVDNSRSVLGDRYQRDRFGRGPTTSRYTKPSFSKDNRNGNISTVGSMSVNDPRRRTTADSNNVSNDNMKHLSKEQRREMFAAKVARDEAEKRMAEERREFETKCRFFGLDPKKTRPQDVPFCVDPSTGQWYSVARQPIPTPPCYAHVQVHPKPKSTDPADYKLPTVVSSLPHQWKYAITALGQIYYYHAKQRIPQWHPPTPEQLRADAEGADSSDSESCEEAKLVNESSEEDEVLMGMDEAQLKAFIDKKVEHRRNKRYNRLVDERPISPRKEEDRIYNQMEMRKYKENKEKIRKRKEEIRRKRAEALKAAASGGINPSDIGENPTADSIATKIKNGNNSDDPDGAIPIQDYLLSSDEEEIMKAECDNSPLLDKIVQGDKIVDELDALTTKRALKRPLPPHRDLSAQPGPSNAAVSSSVISSVGAAGGSSEHKRRKSDKKEKSKKSKDSDSKYRRNKEKFRCEIAGIIVQHLKPYRKESCSMGRIQSNEDFNHLARKLTHFVMVKELKYCESVGQILVVTESVKNKSREFIKKYMAKYGGSYVRPANDPEFKDIPFTL
ncbi:PREDICTED: probable histone-lysine N-methyltransferase CG1716 isoform X1 [Rhagoletis zephyria]|uniref:probable histone-lysine N-methyltransferase CG1716 isoform X1 n=1 Tax=Rhagoletis zephyria TaxID=28612 RepID=UPI00081128A6|nr:PREDICTED: probable histone-lysine N-methyltransferase CG1716 isoform X1 [Rhagoletis zephyria]